MNDSVQPIPGERDVYLVASRSRSGIKHRVDLETGECACERFNESHHYHGQECHHIKAAREYHERTTPKPV